MALVGLHQKALDDLDTAKDVVNNGAPGADHPDPRTALADALCRFDAEALLKAAADDAANAELARLLAFIATEDYSAVHRTLAAGRELLKSNPECYRVHDALAGLGGVSIQHLTSMAGFETFTTAMPKRLASVPGLPATVSRLVDDGAPEPDLLGALVDAGRTADAGEPSWSALGRVLQETRFTQVWRRVDFLDYRLSVASDDFLEEALPLVAGHPYAPFLEVYTLPRPRPVGEELKLLSKVPLIDLSFNHAGLMTAFGEIDASRYTQVFTIAARFDDVTSRSVSQMQRWASGGTADYRASIARWLLETSPYAPLGRATLIETRGVEGLQREAQRRTKPEPSVQMALGRHYAGLQKWDEAEKCLTKRIELLPDAEAYQALADVYRLQKKLTAGGKHWRHR
jgi:tetratricopeptide (TPR) repeat protein